LLGFVQSFQENYGIVSKVRPLQFPSYFIQVIIILTFGGLQLGLNLFDTKQLIPHDEVLKAYLQPFDRIHYGHPVSER